MNINRVFKGKFILMVTFLLTAFFVNLSVSAQAPPKYVFLFIGDGMDIAQRQVAELQLNNAPGRPRTKIYVWP